MLFNHKRQTRKLTLNSKRKTTQKIQEGKRKMITGKIFSIRNHETIVQLLIDTQNRHIEYINFDHRMFKHFYEANTPLKDKTVIYDPNTNTIEVVE